MNPERSEYLLSLVKDKISKESTKFRTSISSKERVLLTIRLLGTEISQQSLSFAFRIGKTATTYILTETSEVIYDSIKDTYLRVSSSTMVTHIKTIRREETWNFLHTIRAIDGKDIRIECPKHSGRL